MPATARKDKKESSPKELAEILHVLDSLDQTHRARDAAGIMSHYAKDAVVFDLSPPLRSRIATSRENIQAWLDTWDGPIELEPRDFKFNVAGDMAYGFGYLRMAGRPKLAGETVDFWMRASFGLRRDGAVWQIIHEHTSVPFYMDGSLRPAFDLSPP